MTVFLFISFLTVGCFFCRSIYREEKRIFISTMATTCALTEHELLDHTFTHKVYLGLTPFIICIGLLGNILTVCVFILTDLKKQSVSILTIALAIVDSFVLLIPVAILWFEKIVRLELTDLSSFWCQTHGKDDNKKKTSFFEI